jgi:hypothetical protein
LTFGFETDAEWSCSLAIEPAFQSMLLRSTVETEVVWSCRVPVSKDPQTQYIPLPITLWTVFDAPQNQLHVMGRLNFVFHSLEGFILGASAYPLRDHAFILDPQAKTLDLHGTSKWFTGHTFDSIDPAKRISGTPVEAGILPTATELLNSVKPRYVIMWILIAITVTAGFCALLYEAYLKPKLLQSFKKKK